METTNTPEAQLKYPDIKLSPKERGDLGLELRAMVEAGINGRGQLEENLVYWNDMLEMRTQPRDWPWPNASNVFIPIVPVEVHTLLANLAKQVFVSRLFLVNGNTADAMQVSHEIERYYDMESRKHAWIEKFFKWTFLSLRDGTGFLEVLWKKTTRKRKVAIRQDRIDEQTGAVIVDEHGKNQKKWDVQEIDVIDYDNVEFNQVSLKDVVVIPAWQTDMEKASAVARALYLSEHELRGMVKAGLLWDDETEAVIESLHPGQSDLPHDRQGVETYTNNDQIEPGAEEGGVGGAVKSRQRGPYKVWRIHSSQYDLNNDGDPEENVLWLHERTGKCIGAGPYQYWHGRRPLIPLSLIPRPDTFVGFSIPELLRTIQEEANAVVNSRNDESEIRLKPPMYEVSGAKPKNQANRWGPDAVWEVNNPNDVGIISLPPIPQNAYIDESLLKSMAKDLTGTGSPSIGGGSGRRTKAEIQQVSALAGVRIELMANRLREAIKLAFEQAHELKIQYGPEETQVNSNAGGQPEQFEISREKLAQDFSLDIAGAGSPLDRNSRLQDTYMVYSLVKDSPIVQGDRVKEYRALRMLLEEFNRPDIRQLIGTEEEAQQKQQQMEQAQQQQAMMQAQQGQQGGGGQPPHGGAPGGSAPGGPPQPPPQGAAPPSGGMPMQGAA